MAIQKNLSFGSVTLKVTPEELDRKSEEVTKQLSTMKKKFATMRSKVKNTKSYWVGSAGDMHRKVYEEKQPDIDEIFSRLEEHARELHEMAAVYTQAESKAKALTEQLPMDVIE